MELKELFPQAHPSFLHFVTVIEQLSRQKAIMLNDVRKGKVKIPRREKFAMPEVPSSYKAYNRKKGKR